MSIVVIGPVTNIARAIMADPTFPSKIKEIVYMGGSFYLPGNSSASAEFNWWADPGCGQDRGPTAMGRHSTEAYELYGNQIIDGLEANHNTGAMPLDLYDQMVANTFPGIQELFLKREAAITERGGTNFAPSNIWDLYAAAYLIDPSIVLSWNDDPRPEDGVPQDIYGVYVDVDSNMGENYGRSTAYREEVGPVGARKGAIMNFIDEEKFWNDIVVPLATGQGE